jgi:8-oxo-dGTP pyrophosphatase MutT (NUDIX family)
MDKKREISHWIEDEPLHGYFSPVYKDEIIEKPIFKNRDNPEHKIDNRTFWQRILFWRKPKIKTIWESRSAAVIIVLILRCKEKIYTLIEKRSSTMMDQPDKWCLPCGYLDWDENGWEAVTRELFEETSIYLLDYEKCIVNDNNKQPFFVNTDPSENRQNVALSYCILMDVDELPQEPLSYKDKEIDKLEWILIENLKNYDFAFNHGERIKMAVTHLFNQTPGLSQFN